MNGQIKKIGINASMLDEHPTGVGVYTYNIINHLSTLYKQQHKSSLTVFTPTVSMLNKEIETVKIPGLVKSSKYGRIAALARFLWNTFVYSNTGKSFDLLISPTTHGSFTLNNQIITIHDLLSLRYKNINSHQRLYFKYLLPIMVARSKIVIAVSETTKLDIVRFLNCPENKVHVIYNGYDSSRYNPGVEAEQLILTRYGFSNYFLAVGPTYPHKNFELLIAAYADLDKETQKKHPLIIAGGKKDYLARLKEIVKASHSQLGESVHFIGYVPAELMPSLYKEACLLVFPSLYEGFGFPLLEAMACGCPVAASNTSSMPEVCGDAALYFNPLNKESITDAMHQLALNQQLRKELIQKGLKRVQEFSWRKSAENLKVITDQYLFN